MEPAFFSNRLHHCEVSESFFSFKGKLERGLEECWEVTPVSSFFSFPPLGLRDQIFFFFTVHFGRPHFFLTEKKITGIFWAITQLGSFVTGYAAAWLMELAFSWLPSPFRALVYCPIPRKKKKAISYTFLFKKKKKCLVRYSKAINPLDVPFPGLQTPRPLPLFLFKWSNSWLMTCESSSLAPTSLPSSEHMSSRSCMCVGVGGVGEGSKMGTIFLVLNSAISKGRNNDFQGPPDLFFQGLCVSTIYDNFVL